MSRIPRILTLAALVTGFAGVAGAQVSSSLQSVSLTASKGQIVTLSAPSPSTQALTITDNVVNQYSAPFAVTVAWDVNSSTSTTVKLVGYFTTPAQALVNGTDYITSARIETSTNGSDWYPTTSGAVAGVGTAGGSIVLYTSPVTQDANHAGNHSVTFQVRINLVGAPTTLAGTYTGTLNLMAICN